MAREDGIDEIEVHVATMCVEEKDGQPRVLIGKRTDQRKLYPGLWECGGGQVRQGQTFQEAVKAQARDEFGLEVDVLCSLNDYAIKTGDKIIPGIRFLCRPHPGQSVRINPSEFDEFKWATPAELPALAMIPGLEADIAAAINRLKNL